LLTQQFIFAQNFEHFSSFRLAETSIETPEVSVGRKKILCKTKNFALKTRNFGFREHEVSVRKPEVSGKIFELETSVKVVFRNASAVETESRNFE
jgi:hypothetical protein